MEAPTEYAIQANSRAEILDALTSVAQMESSIAAFKAVLVNGIATHVESEESPEFRERVIRSEIACALRIPEYTAGELIANSTSIVQELPATMDALQSGQISWRHVEKLVDHAQSIPDSARTAFEDAVLPAARAMTPTKFNERARTIRERMHPESVADRRATAFEKRSVGVDRGRDGMSWITAHLPAEQAEAIDDRLTDIARGLRTEDETRTLPQLRADVFADLLINADPAEGRGVVARVNVTVPVMTLLGKSDEPAHLEGYGPIAPDVARRLCAGAPSFTRLLTHPVTGVVLTVDREKYKPPKELRDWVRLRDGTCRFPGCNRKARSADIDHTLDWLYGGTTDADNLACLCEFHHRLKHNSGWSVKQIGGGVLEWTSPAGRAYRTHPEIDLPTE